MDLFKLVYLCLMPVLIFGEDLQSLGFDANGVSTVTVGAESLDMGSPNPQKKAVSTNMNKHSNNSNVNFVMGVYEGNGIMAYQENGNQNQDGTVIDPYYPIGAGPYNGVYGMPYAGPNPVVDYDTVPAYYQTPYYRNMMR